MTRTFEVDLERPHTFQNLGGFRCKVQDAREFPNLKQAERSARTLCRMHRCPVTIRQWDRDDRLAHCTPIATVNSDGLGRIWTDLSWDGARLL